VVTQISRKYSSADFGGSPTLDQKILIFEDRVLGWQLEIAEEIRATIEAKETIGKPMQHAAFALVSILFSYFEMVAQYLEGADSEGQSKAMFRKGMEAVFPGRFSEDEKNRIYSHIRCGMYHSGLTKKGVLLDGDYPDPILIDGSLVKVNPHKLSPMLKAHFEGYVARLKLPANATERGDFELMYDLAAQV
jgi:hypothetical protein